MTNTVQFLCFLDFLIMKIVFILATALVCHAEQLNCMSGLKFSNNNKLQTTEKYKIKSVECSEGEVCLIGEGSFKVPSAAECTLFCDKI